jgi:hypothetical protein
MGQHVRPPPPTPPRTTRAQVHARLPTVVLNPAGGLPLGGHLDFPLQYSSSVVVGALVTQQELASSLLARVKNAIVSEVGRRVLVPWLRSAGAGDAMEACAAGDTAAAAAGGGGEPRACTMELAAALRDRGGAALLRRSLLIMGGFFPMEMPLALPPTIKLVGPLLPRPGKVTTFKCACSRGTWGPV